MPSSHPSPKTPSAILALIALTIVIRFRPAWASVHLADATDENGISAERVSRLASRLLAPFETLIESMTRRGRPPADLQQEALPADVERTRILLEVTTSMLALVGSGRRRARELVVGAWQRVSGLAGMTQERFCAALALSPRTLRSWLTRDQQRPPAATTDGASDEPPKRGRKPRGPRRKRFGFGVVLPQTQMAADTTDIQVLGVRLKLMATQDIGGRDADLLEGVLIDQNESADKIAQLFVQTLTGLSGAQMLTDQGTPYMASATTATLEQLGVEHAPQKEGDPRGKATIERAFKTIKEVGAVLFDIANGVAQSVPALCSPQLAVPVARAIVSSLLRAYQYGARAAREAIEARGGIDLQTLAQSSAQSRLLARATDRSARLLLAQLHEQYAIRRPLKRFVDALYRYPVSVLQDAEKLFRTQAHRDDIRDRASYFATLVRTCNEQLQQSLARHRRERAQAAKRDHDEQSYEAQMHRWQMHPEQWLRDALDVIANQWNNGDRELLFSGVGPGLGLMVRALNRMAELHSNTAVRDVALGVANSFTHATADGFSQACTHAVLALLDQELGNLDSAVQEANICRETLLAQLQYGAARTPAQGGHKTVATCHS